MRLFEANTKSQQQAAMLDSFGSVESENIDGRAAYRRLADDERPVYGEVLTPLIETRIE